MSASLACTLLAVGFALALLGLFLWETVPVLRHSGWGYLTDARWFHRQQEFGAAAMIYGTLAVSAVALALAVPIGLGTALFLAEIAPSRSRMPLKAALELLAGIPSVVYGLLGILFLREWVVRLLAPFDPLSGDTLLTAGILLAVMILPTFATLADDALRAVPAAHRRAARALGLTRAETILRVCLPEARRGIVAAVLLALGRAFGEGIAVFLVVGRQDNQWPASLLSLRPLTEAGQTLGSKLVGAEVHLAYGDPLHWAAMMGLGLITLLLVTVLTLLATRLLRPSSHHAPRP
ncbi:MAG: phosphate ABC transporter permease subunit PstC [Verrucomicrobiae bacterium]|nr:phosphate ABC transporter permease subunit PstC [Verrucomicrobiae bacterium]